MTAKSYIVLPRHLLEDRINDYKRSYSEPEHFTEYRELESLLEASKPLVPFIEDAFEAGGKAGSFLTEKVIMQYLENDL